MPIAVNNTEEATTLSVPNFLMIGPAKKLTPAVQIIISIDMIGAKLISKPSSMCISGQATPNNESGRPSEIKAKYIINSSAITKTQTSHPKIIVIMIKTMITSPQPFEY